MAALANLQATHSLQEAVVTQAEAEIAAADADIVRTRDDQSPLPPLAATNAASQQRSQRADADAKKAVAAGQKARAALVAAQRQLAGDRHPEAADARRTRAATAERDAAALNVGYTELRAPLDGTVGNRSGRTGAYVAVGAQILSLVPADGLWVDANFKESQLARVEPGMAASVVADVLPGARVPRPRREHRAGHRRAVQRAAAGERDRQLHQDRPARAGPHPARRRLRGSSAGCGPACRSPPPWIDAARPAPRPRPNTPGHA